MSETNLAVRQEQSLAEEPTTGHLLQIFIEKGITKENVEAFREICAERRAERADEAKSKFNAAFTRLQCQLPDIHADRQVNDGRGGVMYQYCSYEEIRDKVKPFLRENGFAVRFSQKLNENGSVTVTCHLMHEGGHTESNDYSARAGRGAPGMNETKIDASASTVAQREAFCDALDIVRRGKDVEAEDAKDLGEFVTANEAAELYDRLEACDGNKDKFLDAAGAKTFETIPAKELTKLYALLRKKESQKK